MDCLGFSYKQSWLLWLGLYISPIDYTLLAEDGAELSVPSILIRKSIDSPHREFRRLACEFEHEIGSHANAIAHLIMCAPTRLIPAFRSAGCLALILRPSHLSRSPLPQNRHPGTRPAYRRRDSRSRLKHSLRVRRSGSGRLHPVGWPNATPDALNSTAAGNPGNPRIPTTGLLDRARSRTPADLSGL